jgi:hypothetical protein
MNLYPWHLFTTLLFASLVHAPSFAQPVDREKALQIVHATSMLAYWQKAPMSLMIYCGRMYPPTGTPAKAEYSKWQKRNAKINSQVDKTLAAFSPLIGKYMKKTPDELQVYMTKATDEEVITPLEKNLSPAERARHCGDFGNLLSQMLSDDLVRPRVNIALETLKPYEKRVPALVADPKHAF